MKPRPVLQLGHLLTFRAVAQELSFTRAARRLHVTQPAVTQQLHALERHFGVKLVDVIGRSVRLSEAGAFLLGRVDLFTDRLQTLERDMHEYANLQRGEVRLGATVTIGSYGLAPLLARFRAAHPQIELNITVENTRRIAEQVHNGELSLALVEGPLEHPDLEIVPYQDDALTLVVPPGHPLAKRRRAIHAAELKSAAFITREEGSGTRDLFLSAFRSAGIEPHIVLALPSGEGIVAAVQEGLGVAVISSLVTRAAVADGRLAAVPIADLDLRRSFRLVTLKRVTLAPAALAFANVVRRKGL